MKCLELKIQFFIILITLEIGNFLPPDFIKQITNKAIKLFMFYMFYLYMIGCDVKHNNL